MGDSQNSELNEFISESITFLKGWKLQSKELDNCSRYMMIQEMKQLDLGYIINNILSEENIMDYMMIDVSGGDCLFGILKIFERVFKDRSTLKQICDEVIQEEQKKFNNQNGFNKLRQNIENAYNQSTEMNIKRSKECFQEILQSHCFIWKYVTKGQIIQFINNVKQQYDNDLQNYFLHNQDFKEGNQKINIDENHLIRILLENLNWLFEKSNNRAMEWIYNIISLFKKTLLIVFRRKMFLNKQMRLTDWYDEEGVLQHWYDPVSAFNSKKFDQKLNNMITQIQNNQSSKIFTYFGKHFESTADTLQCISTDTQIPLRTNRKSNLFNIVKEHVEYLQLGEQFVNIKEDLNQFESDRKEIKKFVKSIYRPSSANKALDGEDAATQINSNGISGISFKQDDQGQKKQRPFSAIKGEENTTKTNDLSASGQIPYSKSNIQVNQNQIVNSQKQLSRNGIDQSTSTLNLNSNKQGQSSKKGTRREAGTSNAGEETAASMNDLPSGEYTQQNFYTSNAHSQTPSEKNKQLELLFDSGQNSGNNIKNKILQELTKEIKTVDKGELKLIIQSERNNIVHQQSEYRKARDLYIKEKQFDENHQKLQLEIQKQMLMLQQHQQNVSTTQGSNQAISLNNTEMKQLQSKFQRAQIGSLKSVPASFKKKQQAAVQSLQQQQAQLQQLQLSLTAGQQTQQGFLSGTTSSNANQVQNQSNLLSPGLGPNDKKGKKKRKVFFEIMKEKWEKKELEKQKMQSKGYGYGNENQRDKDDQNNIQNTTQTSSGSPIVSRNKSTGQNQNPILLQNKFENDLLKLVDGEINPYKKSNGESTLNQQQILKLKKENLLLSNIEKDSLEQQFIKMNQQITLQQKLNKLHISQSENYNSFPQTETLSQNLVKTIKISNKIKPTNNDNLQTTDNSYNLQSPNVSSTIQINQNKKGSFQIRSLSPNSNQARFGKTEQGFYEGNKNEKKILTHSKSSNRSLGRIPSPNAQSQYLKSKINQEKVNNTQSIPNNEKSSPYASNNQRTSIKVKELKEIDQRQVKAISKINKNMKSEKEFKQTPQQQEYQKETNSHRIQNPVIGRNSKSQDRKARRRSSSSSSSTSTKSLDIQQNLYKDLNRYFNQNNYF